jgi:hypothetical protein
MQINNLPPEGFYFSPGGFNLLPPGFIQQEDIGMSGGLISRPYQVQLLGLLYLPSVREALAPRLLRRPGNENGVRKLSVSRPLLR